MNTKQLCLLAAAGGLLLGPRQLLAQDKPTAPAPPPAEAAKPADGPENKPKPEGEHGRRHHETERHAPEMKPTPFIGVMTRALSPEVRAQTGLPDGFGLLVEDVLPESPAQAAGIKPLDVLVLLGDQRLVNMEQLAVLVRSQAKDSEITFTLKRAGAEQKITVKVGEKMMPVPPFGPRWPGSHSFRDMFGRDGEEPGRRFGEEMREKMEHFQRGMHEFQGKMQDWSRNPRDHAAPQPPQFDGEQHRGGRGPHNARPDGEKGPPPNPGTDKDGQPTPPPSGAAPKSQTSAHASAGDGTAVATASSTTSTSSSFERNVTRRDKSGEYSLRQEGESKVFTVKPADGDEQTFTVTTEEQRKAVPEAFRIKLQELDEVSKQVKAEASDEAPASAEARTTTI